VSGEAGCVIRIQAIRAYGRHGASLGERARIQPFEIDAELIVRSSATSSDLLGDAVDYAIVQATIGRIVRERSFALLERLADEIVSELLQDERVERASITVAKPRLLGGATPSVTVSRARAL